MEILKAALPLMALRSLSETSAPRKSTPLICSFRDWCCHSDSESAIQILKDANTTVDGGDKSSSHREHGVCASSCCLHPPKLRLFDEISKWPLMARSGPFRPSSGPGFVLLEKERQ
jgi:hypothetical protein